MLPFTLPFARAALAGRPFTLTTLALRAARIAARALGAGFLARHAHLRNHLAVRRRFSDDRRALRGRALGALRLRSGAAARDQAARSATQAAARTVFAVCFRGLRRALALACRRLRGARFVGACRRHGALGFGRIGVVGMCQNNLKMSGRARPLRARQKKSVTSGAARLGFVVGQNACVLCGITTILRIAVRRRGRVRLGGVLRIAEYARVVRG